MEWEIDPDLKTIQIMADVAHQRTKSDPADVTNWLTLGRCLIHLGRFTQAATCLREAIELFPQSEQLEIDLAQVLLFQNSMEEALMHVKNALSITPADPGARRLYFDLVASQQSTENAALDNSDGNAFSPEIPRLIEMQARSLEPVEVLKLCDLYLAANPAHTNAKYLKAVALAALGKCVVLSILVVLLRYRNFPPRVTKMIRHSVMP
jgi:tetratricopeptide (TPR) repeat protein